MEPNEKQKRKERKEAYISELSRETSIAKHNGNNRMILGTLHSITKVSE
jgi:hypothetical protein